MINNLNYFRTCLFYYFELNELITSNIDDFLLILDTERDGRKPTMKFPKINFFVTNF